MTTGYDSLKMLIISHLVSLVAVPVNASSGSDGVSIIMVISKVRNKIGESLQLL